MTAYKSSLLRVLHERGYIHQVTDPAALDALANHQTVPGYIGFDATAPSLHVGSLVQIMLLRRLQQAGHKPIVLMGGGTTKVGDPSGKDESRRLLTPLQIKMNVLGIKRVFDRFLSFGDGPSDAILLDNAKWLENLKYISFLRRIGPHFTINRMLNFDSVKLRLDREQPLTFLEFNYMILQAYDFLELSRRVGCRLQMGGSDQWGNIVNGMELGRRIDGTELYGLTTPLITTPDGSKMGKTERGAVWLDENLTSPYDYWQFWRNTPDAQVIRFLKLFTDLPLRKIMHFASLPGAGINEAKIALATEATAMLHGRKAANTAAETARLTFDEGIYEGNLPRLYIMDASVMITTANVALGFAKSNKEVKDRMLAGAVKVNGETVRDPQYLVRPGDRISFGKKKHALVFQKND
jgi:tyrosyl-tRNA synthetase